MSVRTLPILFINLGGEMMYIIDQRLRAQTIQSEKSSKVINDIVSTMFNKKFIEELFKPQDVYSKKALYALFEKLAHASIMRLNTASMDKLYDLMIMAFKYQVLMCQSPSDMLLITLNHLDSIRHFVNTPNVTHQVVFAYNLLMKYYENLSDSEFQFIRHNLLNFFQGIHIRVSIFLKKKVQKPNGHFIIPVGGQLPFNVNPPGLIKYFDNNGKVCGEEHFKSGHKFVKAHKKGSTEIDGDRVTTLGTNMYIDGDAADKSFIFGNEKNEKCDSAYTQSAEVVRKSGNSSAKDQLALLSKLLGNAQPASQPSSMFTLNLFDQDDDINRDDSSEQRANVITIDATQQTRSSELGNIMADLDIDDVNSRHNPNDDLDLLELMDS